MENSTAGFQCTEKFEQKAGANTDLLTNINECIRKCKLDDVNPREYIEFLQVTIRHLMSNIDQVQDMRKEVALMALNHAKCNSPDYIIRRQQYEEMLKKYCN